MSDAPKIHNIPLRRPVEAQVSQSARPLAERPQGEPWPEAEPAPAIETEKGSRYARWKKLPLKERGRLPLLIGIPLLVAFSALAIYLTGGRYVSTDNAYVGADKVMVAPEVMGAIVAVSVREGQKVAAGDPLFQVDPEPYRIALEGAKSKLDAARIQLSTLKQSYQKALKDIDMATHVAGVRNKELERKRALAERKYASEADVDAAQLNTAMTTGYRGSLEQQARSILAQLDNDADLPLERFPAYREAKAAVDNAERNLRLATVVAPIPGIVTQTSLVVIGRHVSLGVPALAIVSEDNVWVDANPKETDIENLKAGDTVEIDVDAYPDHTFRGTVLAIGPGTGAEFSVLPAQNSSGNWVKVVQRVPVRIRVERAAGDPPLRAGMSATVSIDTGHSRSFFDLFG
jgi:membrane fusion protein (multidrug efflux system)